jgi:hypothetical protein
LKEEMFISGKANKQRLWASSFRMDMEKYVEVKKLE